MQRFVFYETLQEGCRACDPIGSAITFLDVGPDQAAPVRTPVAVQFFTPKWPGSIELTDLDGFPAMQQYKLSALGYYGSSIDGVFGGASVAALSAFQADYCLPETGQFDQRTLEVLVGTTLATIPPCLDKTQ